MLLMYAERGNAREKVTLILLLLCATQLSSYRAVSIFGNENTRQGSTCMAGQAGKAAGSSLFNESELIHPIIGFEGCGVN